MRYITVTAPTLPEALKKLRNAYGPEAIIFSERRVPSKSLLSRAMGRKQIEIEAAVREKKPRSEVKEKIDSLESLLDRHSQIKEPGAKQIEVSIDTAKLMKDKLSRNMQLPGDTLSKEKEEFLETVARNRPPQGQKDDIGQLHKDISFIKENLANLADRPSDTEIEREFSEISQVLLGQDFSEAWVQEFLAQLQDTMPRNEWKLIKRVYAKARDLIASRILVNPNLGSKRVVVLVGPTGVGKTTTIAKLAARLRLKEKVDVGLVTLDNFRIAATEQLKVFANIMDIPISVCKDPEAFRTHVNQGASDMLLVDTTGFSQNNRDFLATQRQYFEGLEHQVEKHLVLSATSKANDAALILDRFDSLGVDRIILSKTDETSTLGPYIELAEQWRKPFSFLTNGQTVPDDYMEADKKYMAEKVLEGLVSGISYDSSLENSDSSSAGRST